MLIGRKFCGYLFKTIGYLSYPIVVSELSTYKYTLLYQMRVIVQRVSEAKVTVDENIITSIKEGLLLLVGIHEHKAAKT